MKKKTRETKSPIKTNAQRLGSK